MARWEIQEQATGITDIMRINILSAIGTAIDTHGSSSLINIAKEVSCWLNGTYGNYWTVIISDGNSGNYFWHSENKYLKVKETRLGWIILLFKQAG